MNHDPLIAHSLLNWLSDRASFGVLVTDRGLTILYANAWFERSEGMAHGSLVGSSLFNTFPQVRERGFERYYEEAINGHVRILSHRFHKYLIPMSPTIKKNEFEHMQQSCTIAPFISGGEVIGTVTVIEDVTERVSLENELNSRIAETQVLLSKETAAREVAEEINRINDVLTAEGTEMIQTRRVRDLMMHKIIAAQEEERQRIAREIHDNLGQQMTALRFAMSRLRSHTALEPDLASQVEDAEKIAIRIDREVDFLARRVRPSLLDDLGLEIALRAFVDEWSHHVGIDAKLYTYGFEQIRMEPDVEINLYRIAQEALHNISKHSGANKATIMLENRDNCLVMIVEDDGKGFATDGEHSSTDGLGLFSMRERCSLIGALLEIESEPGAGTTVFVRLERPISNTSP